MPREPADEDVELDPPGGVVVVLGDEPEEPIVTLWFRNMGCAAAVASMIILGFALAILGLVILGAGLLT